MGGAVAMAIHPLRVPTDASDLVASFEAMMWAENKSPETVRSYMTAVRLLLEFGGTNWSRHTIRLFLADQLRHHTPATAVARHRGLKSFFRWLLNEGEIFANPMEGIAEPTIPETPVPVFSPEEVGRLLAVCQGTSFFRVRDLGILRVFLGSGIRLEEQAGMRLDDVNLQARTGRVVGKGRRPRIVGLTAKTVEALERYLPLRLLRAGAEAEELWWGKDGPLTGSGIYKAVKRRGKEAGVTVHPHKFRHAFSHRYLADGGREHDLMALNGWRNPRMLARYGASLATERALEAHQRLSPWDNV
jgi:site-specific recombinase XerC